MIDQRNMVIAIVLSIAILIGFQYFYPPVPRQQPAPTQTTASETTGGTTAGGSATSTPSTPGAEASNVPAPPGAATGAAARGAAPGAVETRAAVIAATPRLRIDSPRLRGSIALVGARIDDLVLKDYRKTTDPTSPQITLLNPLGSANAYYAEFGWVPADPAIKVPGPNTVWRTNRTTLGDDGPVTLNWDNGEGLRFIRRIALDDNYMFTITQQVENRSDKPVTLYPYGLINRTGTPKTLGYYILHEGPLGVLGGSLIEIKYKDLKKEGVKSEDSTGGWLGITDKYWLAALVPDQADKIKGRFLYTKRKKIDKYQTDYQRDAVTIAPGANAEVTDRLFAGAKVVSLLDRYRDDLGIPLFDRAVDFGWFYFLTRPIFFALDLFNHWLGNFGLAILLLTVIIKGMFFPLANKSYRAMSKMKKLQPKMTELREKYKDDKVQLQKELMGLYKTEKVNPVSGCLPIVIQIPVFFALYKVLFVTIEMRHAPFFGWIHDLSAPDPTSLFNLFGLLPFDPPSMLAIGAWPLAMGITMFFQQKLNPQPPDPTQAKIMMLLPVVFTFMFARFPAGLVIYYTWNNLLSITQQWVIMRRMGLVGGTAKKKTT